MDGYEGRERRSGEDRRRNAERRNGLAVLMAGCSRCSRIAPSPIEMQLAGWEIISDEQGLVRITCPDHFGPAGTGDDLPDYLVSTDDPR